MNFQEWKERIREIPIEEVCDLAGIPRNGNDILCREHNDRNFGSCKLHRNRYYCFACRAQGDSIRLVQKHFGFSWIESAKWIAEQFHIPAFDEEWKPEEKMEFSVNQLKILGFKAEPSTCIDAKNCDRYKETGLAYISIDQEYIYGNSVLFSMEQLYRENREGFFYIVSERAKVVVPQFINMYEYKLWEFPLWKGIDVQKTLEYVLKELKFVCILLSNFFSDFPIYEFPEEQEHRARFQMTF